MGGRGSQSSAGYSNIAGIKSKHNEYYFVRANGKDYIKRSITGTPNPIPGGLSRNEFIKRALNNGAEVISRKQAAENQRAADEWKNNKERADLLNDARHGIGRNNGGRFRKFHPSNGRTY